MIDKEKISKYFNKEELEQVIRVYNKLDISMKKDISVFTNIFVTPNIWMFFVKNFDDINLKVEASGIFEDSERRVLSFNNMYQEEYPTLLIEITNKSKFYKLTHRDYLGSIMSLGVEREKLGDIRVCGEKAYVPVIDEIAMYIIENLNSIAKSPVETKMVEDFTTVPSVEYQEMIIIVSSLRIDTIAANLCGISRSKSLEYIESSKILLDYSKVQNKKQEVVNGTRITIRGLGKFIIGEIIGVTKSGKQKVKVKKYI